MATLNTLRTKGGWIVTIVIGVSLLAFLVGDLASGNSIFGSGDVKIGSMNGQKISYAEYSGKVEDLNQIQQIMNGGQAVPAEMQESLRNYAWELLQSEIVLIPGLEKLGIEVTDEEMYDRMYGRNISPVLINSGLFNDSEGAFDKTLLQSFVSSYALDPSGQSALLWKHIQDQVRQRAMMEKYQVLVSGMAYTTDAQAARGVQRNDTRYNARYVSQGYETVPDSVIKPTSSEIRDYYNAHRENFYRTASRHVEYVLFEVLPSEKDYADARALVDEMSAEFAQNDNIQQYVTLNSQQSFDPVYYTREQLPADLAEYAFNPNRSEVYGPMLDGKVYTTTRVSDLRSFPDTIAFRQMQFMPGTEALADSIYTVLLNGGDFEALAVQHSVVPAASVDAGRVATQGIPIELGEQIYNTADRLVKIASPAGGAMILDVYYRGPVSPKVQLGSLIYHVEPSSVTQQTAYAKASAFYTATAGVAGNFNRIATDSAYTKRVVDIQAGQTQISGMNEAREMIRWAFNAKTGAISSIMELDNNYVIATLTAAVEEGYAPVEEVRPMITAELIGQKKYEQIAAKMAGAASLDALAQTLSTTVGDMADITYGTVFIPELGTMDPPLVGAVAGGVPQGQLSKPIRGATGVYVVEITSTGAADQSTTPEMERARLEAEAEYNLSARIIGSITTQSKIVDERVKYF